MIRKLLGLLAFAAMLAACGGDDDGAGPSVPDFTGNYTVEGTVNGSTTSDLVGTLDVTNQQGSQAQVAFTANLRTNGVVTQTFATTSPVTATLGSNGSITWTVTSTAQGVTVSLESQGTLANGVITGTWAATSPIGNLASGTFTAQK